MKILKKLLFAEEMIIYLVVYYITHISREIIDISKQQSLDADLREIQQI